ncbi:Hypothetical predicted protein [Mytilus galloprovincialis]|uniref:Fibrinogen C-terminal domain-containing protein n=1 Tax=Mytilus galloprovincialis TaxID=29158 RepID=A0A8B6H8J0_MYTGA|nr:Hypothetical predicted protein [Mytilus galloprovincialis]
MVQQCCSTTYTTVSGRCILDTRAKPETETPDNSNIMMKILGEQSDVVTHLLIYFKIIQRRVDSSINFYRFWSDYKHGFGSVFENHWLGNDNLHMLTTSRNYVVRFEVHDFNNNTACAEYQSFKVDNEASPYRVTFTGYTGTADVRHVQITPSD